MVAPAAAARVNVRDVLRAKAVESYLHNFSSESHRLQEILEVTLSYGIYCVSRNFQLKGMTAEELRTVTKYDQTKTQDFYVRNAAKPRRPDLAVDADPQQLFVKAPHSWRDGDRKPDAAAGTSAVNPYPAHTGNDTSEPEVFFLPNEAHKDKLDEIDFYTRLLGKAFVDVAWTTYSSRGSAYLNADQLQDRMTRVDQRKRPDLIPSTDLPVCSFVDFLNAYVKASVEKITVPTELTQVNELRIADGDTIGVASPPPRRRPTGIDTSQTLATGERAVPKAKARTPPASSAARDGTRGLVRSTSLQHVESKIKPELRAHKEKLLRVKKTQTQLMKESLARTRLAEYAAKREEMANGARPMRRMPLDKITPGAAALEIVDDFIRSPLMDQFAGDPEVSRQRSPRTARRDPLKEELYGIAAHDDSFLGCKAPLRPPSRKPQQTKSTRDYSGWLGDFGPQHTKTVRPAWATDATGDDRHGAHDGDSSEDENHRDNANRSSARSTGGQDRFEWKFDLLDDKRLPPGKESALGRKASGISGGKKRREDEDEDEHEGENDSLAGSDPWSGARSDASDPVYRWLKTAVQ